MITDLFLTLMIAFIIIVLAIACLAIGWLITGKTKVEKACGRDPHKKVDESCGDVMYCDLCAPEVQKRTSTENIDKEQERRNTKPTNKTEENDKRYI